MSALIGRRRFAFLLFCVAHNVGADDHIGPHAALSNSLPYGPDTWPARISESSAHYVHRASL